MVSWPGHILAPPLPGFNWSLEFQMSTTAGKLHTLNSNVFCTSWGLSSVPVSLLRRNKQKTNLQPCGAWNSSLFSCSSQSTILFSGCWLTRPLPSSFVLSQAHQKINPLLQLSWIPLSLSLANPLTGEDPKPPLPRVFSLWLPCTPYFSFLPQPTIHTSGALGEANKALQIQLTFCALCGVYIPHHTPLCMGKTPWQNLSSH